MMSSLIIIKFVLIIYYAHIIKASSIAPEIEITGWLSADDYQVKNLSDPLAATSIIFNGDTIIFKDVRAVVFLCKAKYPTKWNLQQAKWIPTRKNALSIFRVNTQRYIKDFHDKSTYEYWSQLILYGSEVRFFNGNYSCQSTDTPSLQSNRYIFWQDPTDKDLVLTGENITLVAKGQNTIVFPCEVTKPEVDVYLYKQTATYNETTDTNVTSWKPMSLSTDGSIEYDPKNGWTIDIKKVPDIYGWYKCVTNYDDDNILINVVEDGDPMPLYVNAPIKTNATLAYNDTKEYFKCCSNSSIAPQLALYYCDTPNTCQLTSSGTTERWHSLRGRYSRIRGGSRFSAVVGNCMTVRRMAPVATLARCIGDGIATIREYFYPIDTKGAKKKYYLSWKEAEPEKMLMLQPLGPKRLKYNSANVSTVEAFIGEKLQVYLQISTYYFSLGAQWAIEWKNSTIELLQHKDNTPPSDRIIGRRGQTSLMTINIISVEQVAIVGYAPVYNSSEWVKTRLSLTSLVPEVPSIEGSKITEIQWILNDTEKTLECIVNGKPEPSVTFMKDNKTITTMTVTHENGKWILHVPRILHDTHGQYKCIARNFKSVSDKIFNVYVQERSNWNVVIVVACIMSIVSVGLAFVGWKLYAQRKVLTNLRNSTFDHNGIVTN